MRHSANTITHAELDDYRWLVSSEAVDWLVRAAASDGELAARLARLRRDLSPQRAALVLEQVDLRRRARAKFASAERMFFTALGLEQATDEQVATYKAARFPDGGRVVDLCSGIGGDLLALARHGSVLGIDRDPRCALLASANARAVLPENRQPEICTGDATEIDLTDFDAWHIDPDRRPRGRRTTHADWHEPSASEIDALLARNGNAAVKLAPAAAWPESWTARAELEWTSRARSCRQLVAWFGSLVQHPGQRRATRLDNSGQPLGSFVGRAEEPVPLAPRIEGYLHEPDAAVLAARLDGALARAQGVAAISPGVAYWTGSQALTDPLVASFAVDEVLRFDVKQLGKLLRAREIGRLEIKVRGVDEDPARLRRQLRPSGDAAATLLVTRIERRVIAILARRVDTDG